jgi:solute carrier family 25 S-adenosylmethionine transporter 26
MIDWHEIGKSSLSTTAICAAISRVTTKTVLFPLDTIKARMQYTHGHTRSLVSTWRTVANPRGIFNGLGPKILLYAPYQSVYMTTYTAARDFFVPIIPIGGFAISGICAELSGAIIRVPMEAIKQRMQTGGNKDTRHLVQVLRDSPLIFFAKKNFIAQTCLHDIPFGIIHWVVYENLKRDGDLSSPAAAGAAAGVVTSLITNPLDVVKTRMVTRGHLEDQYSTVRGSFRSIFASGRFGIFFRGWLPRVMHTAPSSALYMFIFDKLYKTMTGDSTHNT